MPGTGEGFGAEVAAWLRAALRDAAGRDKLTHDAVIKRSKVGRGTFYRLLNGEGGEVEQPTLDRLAEVLGVAAPTIRRRLETTYRLDVPPTPLALVREAKALLDRAEGVLETKRTSGPRAGEVLEEARLVERVHRQQRSRKRQGDRPA